MNEFPPDVILADAKRPAQVRFSWGDYAFTVTMENPPQVRVSAQVYAEFGRELVDFFGLLSRRVKNLPTSQGMRGGWRVASNDDELVIEAWCAEKGFMQFSVSLASDMWDPDWVFRLNISVPESSLPHLAESVEAFFRYEV